MNNNNNTNNNNFVEFIHFVYDAAAIKSFAIYQKTVSRSFKVLYLTIMSSIVTAVFKATIGLLVNKGRDKAAEKLKDGDVTDQTFRGLIVREIDDIKSKLDGLSRKDLLASMSFFREGIEFLYEVFDDMARSRSEEGKVTTQATCAEAFSLVKEVRNKELTDLDESTMRALFRAKKRFEDARKKATEAFNNEALESSDRILAMEYRVMATILETVDNPADAVAPCKVCLEELNSLPVVRHTFEVQLKKGIQAFTTFKRWFNKDEHKEITSNVYHVNRVIYDVTQMVGEDVHLWIWPAVDTGENKVDPLRDRRITKVLREQNMEHCCVTPWSLGQKGEDEQKLKNPWAIATNSSGQFIVGDRTRNVKVFDSTGKFIKSLSLPNDDVDKTLYVLDIATDMNDNIYVLVRLGKPGAESDEVQFAVYEFNNTDDLRHKFDVRGDWDSKLTVTESGKVLVLRSHVQVEVYKGGRFSCSFGEKKLSNAKDITAANDGRVMVVEEEDACVHIFKEDGNHINKFKLQGRYCSPRIAFHWASKHVVVASVEEGKDLLHVEIYTKDGKFVRSTQIHEERITDLGGITVTTKGHIAATWYRSRDVPVKVLVL